MGIAFYIMNQRFRGLASKETNMKSTWKRGKGYQGIPHKQSYSRTAHGQKSFHHPILMIKVAGWMENLQTTWNLKYSTG
jgi:hypothetical protein